MALPDTPLLRKGFTRAEKLKFARMTEISWVEISFNATNESTCASTAATPNAGRRAVALCVIISSSFEVIINVSKVNLITFCNDIIKNLISFSSFVFCSCYCPFTPIYFCYRY